MYNIDINKEIRSGAPCVKGSRISVFDIINWIENGMSFSEIISDFPELTISDINESIQYFQEISNKKLNENKNIKEK
jgi:uncharacterized protein (DUF433 family)